MKYFVGAGGKYLGGWSYGGPVEGVEVPDAPQDARQVWDFPGWGAVLVPFNDALSAVNAEYQKDVDSLNKAFSLAIMFDGPSEEPKKANIRAQYSARKTKYAADLAALREQYGA